MDSKCRVQKVFRVGLNDLIAAVNLQFLETIKSHALLLKILTCIHYKHNANYN